MPHLLLVERLPLFDMCIVTLPKHDYVNIHHNVSQHMYENHHSEESRTFHYDYGKIKE